MQVTGLEYELYLQRRLAAVGVPFWSEGELRQLGFHKTPDVKLKVSGARVVAVVGFGGVVYGTNVH